MQDFMYKLPHGTIENITIDDGINGKDARNLILSIWNICLNKYQQHQVYLHYFIDEVLEKQTEASVQAEKDETDITFKNSFTGKPYVREDADKQDEVTNYFIESVAILQKNCPSAAKLALQDIEMAHKYDLTKAVNTSSTEAVCKHLLDMLWEADHLMMHLKDTTELEKAKEAWDRMQTAIMCYLNNADLSTDV